MMTPAPVSGEGYSMGFTSETRSNYLSGGLIFSTAYQSDVTTGSNGQPISDVTYTILPTISLNQTRSRLHWVFTYSPGFAFLPEDDLAQSDQSESGSESRLSSKSSCDAEPARYVSAIVQRFESAEYGSSAASVRWRIRSQLLCDSSERRSAHKYCERHSHLPVRCQCDGRSQRNLRESVLSEPITGSRARQQFKFEGWFGILLAPLVENALHRRNLSISGILGEWDGGAERNPCPKRVRFLYYLLQSKNLRFILRRSAIFQHAAARSAFITRVVAGWWCEFRLAGKTDQLCGQLLTNDQRRRWLERCCACVQCERLVAPATHAEIECRDRSELFGQ